MALFVPYAEREPGCHSRSESVMSGGVTGSRAGLSVITEMKCYSKYTSDFKICILLVDRLHRYGLHIKR